MFKKFDLEVESYKAKARKELFQIYSVVRDPLLYPPVMKLVKLLECINTSIAASVVLSHIQHFLLLRSYASKQFSHIFSRNLPHRSSSSSSSSLHISSLISSSESDLWDPFYGMSEEEGSEPMDDPLEALDAVTMTLLLRICQKHPKKRDEVLALLHQCLAISNAMINKKKASYVVTPNFDKTKIPAIINTTAPPTTTPPTTTPATVETSTTTAATTETPASMASSTSIKNVSLRYDQQADSVAVCESSTSSTSSTTTTSSSIIQPTANTIPSISISANSESGNNSSSLSSTYPSSSSHIFSNNISNRINQTASTPEDNLLGSESGQFVDIDTNGNEGLQETKKRIFEILLWFLGSGSFAAVFSFIRFHMTSVDRSIVRNYLEIIFDNCLPPYSTEFVESILGLLKDLIIVKKPLDIFNDKSLRLKEAVERFLVNALRGWAPMKPPQNIAAVISQLEEHLGVKRQIIP